MKVLKQNIGDDHDVRKIVKKEKYRSSLDLLYVFRNYAAHDSEQSKNRVKDLLKMDRISGAGAWLKKQNRLEDIAKKLIELVEEIRSASFK